MFKPDDQAAQLATWIAVYQLGAAWGQLLHEHPVALSPVNCERPWLAGFAIALMTLAVWRFRRALTSG